MGWYLNPALTALRAQIDARWPNRPRGSDGTLGDAAHAARKSEHNRDPDGSVDAIDISNGGNVFDVDKLLAELIASGDRRLKHAIRKRRIWTKGVGWSAYGGPNAHDHHLHLDTDQRFENDGSPWKVPMLGYGPPSVIHLPYPDLTKPTSIKHPGGNVGTMFVQRAMTTPRADVVKGGVYTLCGNILTGIQTQEALSFMQALNRLAGVPDTINVLPDAVFDSYHLIQG